jgi:uncharacterized protein YbjT (DUF2867 family)
VILVVGATGSLGRRLVPLLTAKGHRLRLLVREPARTTELEGELVEAVAGDVRDPAAVARAMRGASAVIAAMTAFGRGAGNAKTVDWQGNVNLIRAAEAAGVEHFILFSLHGASSHHPIEVFRMKYRAEQELLSSQLAWTLIRPTAYFETWLMVMCEPLLKTGKTVIFGRGDNPINFVSAGDAADFAELAVTDVALRGETIEVGGPENISFNGLLEAFQSWTGASGDVRHLPRTVMRVASQVLRPINPMRAWQTRAAYIMDTEDMTFDPSETVRRFPTFVPTPFAAVLARNYPRMATADP